MNFRNRNIFSLITTATLFAIGCGNEEMEQRLAAPVPMAPIFGDLSAKKVAFVMTNDAKDNHLLAFNHTPDIHVTKLIAEISTGGKGGVGGNGGGIATSPDNTRVALVNAGSGTVSLYTVGLTNDGNVSILPMQTLPDVGMTPVSVAFGQSINGQPGHLYVLSGKTEQINGKDVIVPVVHSFAPTTTGYSQAADSTVTLNGANGPAQVIVLENGKLQVSARGTDNEDGNVFQISTLPNGAIDSAIATASVNLPSRMFPLGMTPVKGGSVVTIAHSNWVYVVNLNGQVVNTYASPEKAPCWAASTTTSGGKEIVITGNTGGSSLTSAHLEPQKYDVVQGAGYVLNQPFAMSTFNLNAGPSDVAANGTFAIARVGTNLGFYNLNAEGVLTFDGSTQIPKGSNGTAIIDLASQRAALNAHKQ